MTACGYGTIAARRFRFSTGVTSGEESSTVALFYERRLPFGYLVPFDTWVLDQGMVLFVFRLNDKSKAIRFTSMYYSLKDAA